MKFHENLIKEFYIIDFVQMLRQSRSHLSKAVLNFMEATTFSNLIKAANTPKQN